MKTINILHISDLHATKNSISLMSSIVSSLSEDVSTLLAGEHIDIVAFTGDIVHSGSNGSEDANLAFDTFLFPLLKNLDVNVSNLFICPGNHDNDLSKFNQLTFNGLHAELGHDINKLEKIFSDRSIFDLYDTAPEYWTTDIQSRNVNISAISPISWFSIKEFDKTKVGIGLFNTAWSSCGKSEQDVGNLIWGYPELEHVYNSLAECEIKIMLMHHPTYYLSEFEKSSCETILARFDLVLSGHLHQMEDKQIHSPLGETLYLTAGRLDSKHTDLSGYSLIQINPFIKNITVDFRKYYADRNTFDKALSVAPEGRHVFELTPTDETLALAYAFATKYNNYFVEYAQSDAISVLLRREKGVGYIEPILKSHSALEMPKKPVGDIKDIVIDTIVRDDKCYLIYGRPQYGKSALLKYISLSYFENFSVHKRVPLLVDMNHIDLKGKNQLRRALQKSISEISNYNLSMRDEQIESLFYGGYSTILVDNVDLHNSKQRDIITDFHRSFPEVKLILTTIENQLVPEYTEETAMFKKQFEHAYLHAFSKSSLRAYVSTFLSENIDDIDGVVDKVASSIQEIGMAKTPFNAIMLLTVFNDVADFQAINEATLIERFMEIILEKINPDEVKSDRFDFKNKEDYLSFLAKYMYANKQYCIPINDYNKLVEAYFAETGLDRKASNFDRLFLDKNILVIQNDEVFFSYTFLSEYYLAKSYLSEGVPEEIYQNLHYLNYANELIYYAGLKRKDIKLFEVIHKDLQELVATLVQANEHITSFKLRVNIDYSTPLSKPSAETRAILTDLPEKSINDTPSTIKRKNTKSKDYSKGDKATLIPLLFLYAKLLRNYEYLEPRLKQEGIRLCVEGTNSMIYNFDQLLTRFADEELPTMKRNLLEEGEKLEDVNKNLQSLMDIFKMSIPLTLQTSMATWFASKKLSPQFTEIAQCENLTGMNAFLFYSTLIDMESGYDIVLHHIKNEKDSDLLNLLYFKIRLAFYYTTSPTEEKRLESLLGALMSRLNPTSVKHKTIESYDKKKAMQELYREKRKMQQQENDA